MGTYVRSHLRASRPQCNPTRAGSHVSNAFGKGGFRRRRIRAWTRGVQSAGQNAIEIPPASQGVGPPVETRHNPCPPDLYFKLREILRCLWLRTSAMPIPSEHSALLRSACVSSDDGGNSGGIGNLIMIMSSTLLRLSCGKYNQALKPRIKQNVKHERNRYPDHPRRR